MKKFNPREKVNIYNNWPKIKYPIKGKVYFYDVYTFLPTFDDVKIGVVTWYHPTREIDASCVISPGFPFYKIKVKDERNDLHISANQVAPRNKAGFEKIKKEIIKDWDKAIEKQKKSVAESQGKLKELIKNEKGLIASPDQILIS